MVFAIALSAVLVGTNPVPATDTTIILKKAFPAFDWQKDSVISIDINADGITDWAALGYTEKIAAVGVVLGVKSGKPKATFMDFSRGGNYQRGMCGRKAKLVSSKQTEEVEQALEEMPEGYKICPRCFEIKVEDNGGCDYIYIYWNHKAKDLDWWRL